MKEIASDPITIPWYNCSIFCKTISFNSRLPTLFFPIIFSHPHKHTQVSSNLQAYCVCNMSPTGHSDPCLIKDQDSVLSPQGKETFTGTHTQKIERMRRGVHDGQGHCGEFLQCLWVCSLCWGLWVTLYRYHLLKSYTTTSATEEYRRTQDENKYRVNSKSDISRLRSFIWKHFIMHSYR